MSDLKSRTVTAIKWSYFSMFSGLALQLLFAAILSRLLTKEQFGVWYTATLLQSFGQFIANLGVGQAIVQKAKLTDDDVRAGFTSSILLGVLATALAWISAPYAGTYFNNPDLVPIFRAYSWVFVINSGIVVSHSLLRRALKFRPLVISELSMYILGHGILGLGSAYLGYGTYSLVISALSQGLIQLIILYAATRHTLRPVFRWSAYKDLYLFGTRATVVTFLEFISGSLDTFLIAKLYNPAALGLYSRTFSTIAQPAMGFAMSLSRVLAPSFSAVQGEPERLKRAYLSGLRALSLIIFTAAGCIVVDAPEIVRVMLGPTFLDSIVLMQIFAFFIPFSVLTNLSGVLAEATAHLKSKIVIQSTYFITLLIAFWSTHQLGMGVEAFAVVLVIWSVFRSAAFAILARRIIQGGGRDIAFSYLLGGACGLGAALLTAAIVIPLRAILPLPALFITEVILGGLMLGGVVILGPPNELQRMAKASLSRLTRRSANSAG
ncbi:lipopolysaccharide biosynthesis protein [Deinococcus koreensis]|uniref:Lipopolysaccharide biosynthesis protein n=1 Tax=Deinococcus koreensis TaxID=2054903 RepID=A0A2K3UTB9_9DEIO|nr:lipopolysaccharide biosynthesis protein [Deinococcus koreensis]PNY79779.1 lipopolysaccharide biosynthesis protein [Deinococcus koreensis]